MMCCAYVFRGMMLYNVMLCLCFVCGWLALCRDYFLFFFFCSFVIVLCFVCCYYCVFDFSLLLYVML